MLMLLGAFSLCAVGAMAQTPVPAPASAPAPAPKWDFLQPGFWFDVPTSMSKTEVYGARVGLPFCSGKAKVCGLETAVLCGATDTVYGAQACVLASIGKYVDGLQLAVVNYCESVDGVQVGAVNVATKSSCQVGLVNYIEGARFPVTLLFNYKF